MEVTVSAFRAELASWIDRVRAGEEIVVTDRGIPVARVRPVDSAPLLDELTRRGVLTKPASVGRPVASGARRVPATGSVADLVSEQRR